MAGPMWDSPESHHPRPCQVHKDSGDSPRTQHSGLASRGTVLQLEAEGRDAEPCVLVLSRFLVSGLSLAFLPEE